jgi:hypothetical protein
MPSRNVPLLTESRNHSQLEARTVRLPRSFLSPASQMSRYAMQHLPFRLAVMRPCSTGRICFLEQCLNRHISCDSALEASAPYPPTIKRTVVLPGQRRAEAKPRTFLTDRRIHFHSQYSCNDYADLLMLNRNMSDHFGDPDQAWNSPYWTYTESGQPPSHISPSLYPSVPTIQLDRNLLEQWMPLFRSAQLSQYTTQNYSQLLGTHFQQSQWTLASWDQSNQSTTLSTQQGQLSHPHDTSGGAAYVVPQLSITAATSNHFSPEQQSQWTATQSRHTYAKSSPSSASSLKVPEVSRSESRNSVTLTDYGFKNPGHSWSCALSGCTSRIRFTRACDLRKHYKRHSKSLFCRYNGCPQSTQAGFSSKKDRARHEAKHNPKVMCEWQTCGRLFSRVDNMVRRRLLHCTVPTYYEVFC